MILILILKQRFIKQIIRKYYRNKYQKPNTLVLNDMINIKSFDSKSIKMDKKSHTKTSIFITLNIS